jgi:magnesium transporter
VRHGESALAVVDQQGRFIGLITPHRLLAVLLAEHEEDLSRLGGFLKTTSVARDTTEEPVRRRLWHRLPWLLLGLFGALVAADVVGRFEELLRVQVMLAFFMPGIVYLADAVGTQTETVIVRGLSLGDGSPWPSLTRPKNPLPTRGFARRARLPPPPKDECRSLLTGLLVAQLLKPDP